MIVPLSQVQMDPDSFAIKASYEDKNPWTITGVPGNSPKPIGQCGFVNVGETMNLEQWARDNDGPSRVVVVDEAERSLYLYDASIRGKK